MKKTVRPAEIPVPEIVRTDVVVVGSGIAGLYAALHLDPRLSCLIVTKEASDHSNSWLAQGGIAAAIAPDDEPQIHWEDTLIAGAGLCDEAAVRVLVDEGPDDIDTLRMLRVPFDLENGGDLSITREGGHTRRRVVHAGGDATGRETVKVLAALASVRPNIRFAPHGFLVDILVEDNHAKGILLYDGSLRMVLCRSVILCTGGIGQAYAPYTTNPPAATGEGMAAALRAGAELEHMEFIQFHPTVLSLPGQKAFLISEAVRGEGAVLRNGLGEAFMQGQHPMADLAPRDIVSRAIERELRRTGDACAYLDITTRDEAYLARRFPTIWNHCLRLGLRMDRDLLPVRPAQHYMVGGIATDLYARTTVDGLYACGEVAYTGVHGANRLASNSMLECLVFGRRAALHISGNPPPRPHHIPALQADKQPYYLQEPDEIKVQVSGILNRCGGIVRNGRDMEQGLCELNGLLSVLDARALPTPFHWEAYGMALIAREILQAALARTESVGTHYRDDT